MIRRYIAGRNRNAHDRRFCEIVDGARLPDAARATNGQRLVTSVDGGAWGRMSLLTHAAHLRSLGVAAGGVGWSLSAAAAVASAPGGCASRVRCGCGTAGRRSRTSAPWGTSVSSWHPASTYLGTARPAIDAGPLARALWCRGGSVPAVVVETAQPIRLGRDGPGPGPQPAGTGTGGAVASQQALDCPGRLPVQVIPTVAGGQATEQQVDQANDRESRTPSRATAGHPHSESSQAGSGRTRPIPPCVTQLPLVLLSVDAATGRCRPVARMRQR
jgi:hypothetical protein